jgi:hypothetical protein
MRALFAIVAFTLAAPAAAEEMALAKGAELRILDKLTGQLTDADLPVGQSVTVGKLTVQMNECRYPASNQTADAEAHLTISDTAVSAPVFTGWMISSSPALSALDHPRYDVWVMRCDVPQLALPAVEPLPEGGEGQPASGGAEGGASTDAGTGQ